MIPKRRRCKSCRFRFIDGLSWSLLSGNARLCLLELPGCHQLAQALKPADAALVARRSGQTVPHISTHIVERQSPASSVESGEIVLATGVALISRSAIPLRGLHVVFLHTQ